MILWSKFVSYKNPKNKKKSHCVLFQKFMKNKINLQYLQQKIICNN